jgi:hypothetical protein
VTIHLVGISTAASPGFSLLDAEESSPQLHASAMAATTAIFLTNENFIFTSFSLY